MTVQRMTYQQYEQVEGLRHSALKRMADSPLACQWAEHHPGPDRRALSIGKATHSAVLEPHAFEREFVVFDGTRRGKAWEAFVLEHPTEQILTVSEYDEAGAIAEAVRANAEARAIIDGVTPEVCVTWDEAGVRCKARLDGVAPAGVIELKTTRRPYNRPHGGFPGEFAKYLYHSQLAWYRHGLQQNERHERAVLIICAQNEPPWEVGVYEVPGPVLAQGEVRWRALFAHYLECRAAGQWPGFAGGKRLALELPEWAYEDAAQADTEGLTDGDF